MSYVTRFNKKEDVATVFDGVEVNKISKIMGKNVFNLPVNTILMYHGSEIDSPNTRSAEIGNAAGDTISMPGWYVCNGNSGTPDLTDSFVRAGFSPGTTGGDDTTNLISHDHGGDTGSDGGHSHSTGNRGDHTHDWPAYENLQVATGNEGNDDYDYGQDNYFYTDSEPNHTHGGVSDASNHDHGGLNATGSSSLTNKPAYKTLLFIIRLDDEPYKIPVGTIFWFDDNTIGNISSRTDQIGDDGSDSVSMPGWYVCNGNSGTIDLIDRFIRAQTNVSTGSTGGVNTISDVPYHSHSLDLGGSHNHTMTANGGHNHTISCDNVYIKYDGVGSYGLRGVTNEEMDYRKTVTTDDDLHRHSINSAGSHGSHSVSNSGSVSSYDNKPVYYSMFLIQKVS